MGANMGGCACGAIQDHDEEMPSAKVIMMYEDKGSLLSFDQRQELRLIFLSWDEDGDGLLEPSDLLAALLKTNNKGGRGEQEPEFVMPSEETFKTVMEQVLGSSKVPAEKVMNCSLDDSLGIEQWDEFISQLIQGILEGSLQEVDLTAVFEDVAGEEGYVTMDTLVAWLQDQGEDLSPEDIRAIFEEGDVDGDGKISFEEFTALLQPADHQSDSSGSLLHTPRALARARRFLGAAR